MAASGELPSRSEINRCGDRLVDFYSDPSSRPLNEMVQIVEAVKIARAFRAAHQRPMGKVAVGLRSMVVTATGEPPAVSQRLKRVPRIVRKLARMDRSMLARLEDIGGCRAVLAGPREIEAVQARIERFWGSSITRRRDHIASPAPSGYRAFHYVVRRDDRLIEVQLRTFAQQRWANAVEAADSRHGLTLKDGTGPESMIEYFAAASDVLFAEEYGHEVNDEMRTRLDAAGRRVVNEGFYGRSSSS